MAFVKTRVAVVGLLIAITTGCTGQSSFGPQEPVLGQAGCKPPSPVTGPDRNFEVLGTPIAEGATASGLFFEPDVTSQAPSAALERKFVVRVTGEGHLGATLVDPSGKPAELTRAPAPHATSSFKGSEDEWDMGLTLDQPGCWSLTLSRDETPTASFWFEVG